MSEMPTYEELLAQNNYLKNHAKYQATQLDKKDKEIKELKKQNKELEINYNWILEQLKLSKRQKFGSSAESIMEGYEQINLFNEAEAERTAFKLEPTVEEVVKRSSKSKKKSIKDRYKNLEVEEIIHTLPDEDKICNTCGSEMNFMRYDISHKIRIIPAKAILEVHKTEVYVCKECDNNGTEGSFKTAQSEPSLIEKSLATPSLIAYILNQKFCLGLPLYRQEQELRRMNIYFSRQTMANWVIAAAKMLKPLYDKLHKKLVERNILHADETTLEVLKLPNRDTPLNAYMWVYRTGRFEECPIVLYDYEEGRSGSYAKEFLKGFSGYLHCDGWSGYDKVENIKRVGCWVHVRRKFYDALKIQADPKDYSTIAGQAFLMIEKLFEVERISPDKPAEIKVIVEMHLSGGECHDGPEGRLSIKKVGTNFEGVPILMDRAYEGDKTRKLAKLYGHDPVVPPKKNRIDPWEYDKELYKKRNMVERLFRWLKEFRKVCTRYDKTDMMYLAFIQFACILVWIK